MKNCPHCGKAMQCITQSPGGPYWHCGCGQDVYEGNLMTKNPGGGPHLPSETRSGKGRSSELPSVNYKPHGRVQE